MFSIRHFLVKQSSGKNHEALNQLFNILKRNLANTFTYKQYYIIILIWVEKK